MTASRQQEVGQPHTATGVEKYDDDQNETTLIAPPLSLFRCSPTIGLVILQRINCVEQ